MKKNIPRIILLFLLLQPFLDVIAGLSTIWDLPNIIGIIFRFSFFIFCGIYILFFTKKESKKTKLYLILLIVYLSIFLLHTVITKDTSVFFYELQNTFNTFYFPVIFIALYQMIEEYQIEIKLSHIILLFFIYNMFVFIPTITNTNLASYAISKTGSMGWFNSANSISSILSLLLPFTLIYIKNHTKHICIISITAIITLYVLFTIGTKVPILCIGIIILCNIIYYIIYLYKNKKIKQIISILCICFILSITSILLIPKTSFYKNIQIHMDFLEINSPIEVLKDPYLLDHFIFSQRLSFLKRTHTNYINASLTSKIIGIGYIENYGTDEVNLKTIEMDYFDVFYRHGIIGCILFFLPLVYYVKKKHHKIENSFTKLNITISVCLIFILAFFSGHIFVAPATSIIVAMIFILYDQNNLQETIK